MWRPDAKAPHREAWIPADGYGPCLSQRISDLRRTGRTGKRRGFHEITDLIRDDRPAVFCDKNDVIGQEIDGMCFSVVIHKQTSGRRIRVLAPL